MIEILLHLTLLCWLVRRSVRLYRLVQRDERVYPPLREVK